MSIKKSLIAAAVMAFALMGFASSAMAATDGVIRDVANGAPIVNNKEVKFVGAAAFLSGGTDGIECHVASTAKATGAAGTGGDVTSFTVPDPTKCTGKGLFSGCTVASVTATNTPYTLTATPTDIDVTGNIVIDNSINGFLCPDVTLTFTAITLKPLGTKSKHAATGTSGNLGTTVSAGDEAISGVELSGNGTADLEFGGNLATVASGELEIVGTDRCTYRLAAS